MKQSFFFLCLVFLLAWLAPSQGLAGAGAQPMLAPLHSVKADFVQEKHLKILARPLISTGTFIFQAPQSLRWEYRTPIASLLLMHDGKAKKYTEHEGRLQEEQAAQLDAMQLVLTEISGWLSGHITDNRMFAVSFPNQRTILLTPKEAGFAALISGIQLKLADEQGLLDEVTIFEGGESYTRLTFSNRVLNQELPASLFTDR